MLAAGALMLFHSSCCPGNSECSEEFADRQI
jgi:hypothetical protein